MTIVKAYVSIPEGQVHYRHVPGKGIPVVFLHQTASSGQMYIKAMERMQGGRPLYAFDTPGFGGSFDPDPDLKPGIDWYVDCLHAALQGCGIKRAHIAGHHTGSCIAVELAARYPDMVQSLTMVGPVPLTDEERHAFSQHFGLPFQPTVSGSYLLDNWEYLRALGAAQDVMLFHREMADQLRAYWGRVQSYGAVWKQDFPKFYRAVACPIMIAAAEDDVLYPYLGRAAEMRPDARVLPISGANFEPDLDADTYVRGLEDFIAQAETA
jgi:pimeloyl-ACP methyl ester carboxylesterase